MSPHVSMIGAAFAGNKGAAAILTSTIESALKVDPGTTFTLFSMYPSEDRVACPYPQVEIVPATPRQLGLTINLLALVYKIFPPARSLLRRRSRAVAAMLKSSMLVDQMGISFTDGRELYLLFNTAALLPAFLLGVPVVKSAQAIGPFNNFLNKLVSKLFLRNIEVIISRGKNTQRFCEELGLRNIRPGADSAFLLKEDASKRERKSLKEKAPILTVGIVPSQVLKSRIDKKSPGRYQTMMTQVIESLGESGYRIKLIAHSARNASSTQNNDLPLCRAILANLSNRSAVEFIEGDRSIEELRGDISSCDVLLTGRFHAMVSALATGVPPVVMGWGHKYEEVLDMFGLKSSAVPYQDCTAEVVTSKIRETLMRAEEISLRIEEELPMVIDLARVQDVVFSEQLTENKLTLRRKIPRW